jgi:hypothetical protein
MDLRSDEEKQQEVTQQRQRERNVSMNAEPASEPN